MQVSVIREIQTPTAYEPMEYVKKAF